MLGDMPRLCSLSEDRVVKGAAVEIFSEAAELGLRLAGVGTCSLESEHCF